MGTGVMMPLPFLNVMEAAKAKEPTQRFVSLFKPNGVHPPTWEVNNGKEYDYEMSALLKPLSDHKQDLLVMANMGTRHQAGHNGANSLCGVGRAREASMDQVLAEYIGKNTPLKSLELTTEGIFQNKADCSYVSYDKQGRFVPRNSDAQLVFDQLFRNPLSNPKQKQQIISVLDSVKDHSKSFEKRLGKDDKATLDEYLTLVRDTERKLHKNSSIKNKADFSALKRPVAGAGFDQQVDQMLDIMVMALQTDSTRVISYMLGNDNSRLVFDFLGVNEEHHYLSHFYRNFSIENVTKLNKINLWHIEKYAKLINKLKQVREGERTLLDNTVVMFSSGMGHSDIHSGNRIPTLLAGGKDMIKTGRYVNHSKGQSVSGMLLTLLQGYGVKLDKFHGHTETIQGMNDSNYEHFVEKKVKTYLTSDKEGLKLQGKFRLSTNIETPRLQLMDIDGLGTVEIEVPFKTFNKESLPFYYGKNVYIEGKGTQKGESWKVTDIHEIKEID